MANKFSRSQLDRPFVVRYMLEEKQELMNDSPRIPILYLIPKIHKDLNRPPGRPIVSGVESIFSPLAIYVDDYLQEVVKELPKCLRDTGDFFKSY